MSGRVRIASAISILAVARTSLSPSSSAPRSRGLASRARREGGVTPSTRRRPGLDELRVDRLDLLFAPLHGLLEIELVRAELGQRVHHHELLVDLVRGRGERPRIARSEVVV